MNMPYVFQEDNKGYWFTQLAVIGHDVPAVRGCALVVGPNDTHLEIHCDIFHAVGEVLPVTR